MEKVTFTQQPMKIISKQLMVRNYFLRNSVFEIRTFDDLLLIPRFDKAFDAVDNKRN